MAVADSRLGPQPPGSSARGCFLRVGVEVSPVAQVFAARYWGAQPPSAAKEKAAGVERPPAATAKTLPVQSQKKRTGSSQLKSRRSAGSREFATLKLR